MKKIKIVFSKKNMNRENVVEKQSHEDENEEEDDDNKVYDFSDGLRVLAVDDEPTSLRILKKMLELCKYKVTTCNRAEDALALLRRDEYSYDLVLSDVHMPDMDGLKLLEHIGLEMDLPVIMMSADEELSLVRKGVLHGACDYLIKPVRMEELRNIWQHVVRKKNKVPNDPDPASSLASNVYAEKQPETPDKAFANKGQNVIKRRKEEGVVWTRDLHSKFVTAVNQIGYEKAVPKKILELMNIPGLTRENVTTHLQKYRRYLKRIHKENEPDPSNTLLKGKPGAGYRSIASPSEQEIQPPVASGHIVPAQSLAALQPVALGMSSNLRPPIPLPQINQQQGFTYLNQTITYGQVQNLHGYNSNISNQINFLDGTLMGPQQPAGLQYSVSGMYSPTMIPITYSHASRPPVLPNGMINNQAVLQPNAFLNIPESTGNGFLARNTAQNFSILSPSTLQNEGYVPCYGLSNNPNQNIPHHSGLQGNTHGGYSQEEFLGFPRQP